MKPGPAGSSADEDKQDLNSQGKEGDVSAQQRAALQSLDAQLSRLSDKDAGQLNPRRRFAEDLARKTGRATPSQSPPSKRTLAGDYLDSSAWTQKDSDDMAAAAAANAGFEVDGEFLAYTAGALLLLTLVTNLFLNKFFPLMTKAQIKEKKAADIYMVFPDRAPSAEGKPLQTAPPLRN